MRWTDGAQVPRSACLAAKLNLMSVTRFLLTRLGRLAAYPIHHRIAAFARACDQPEAVQTDLLLRTLRRQADTAFGRDHGFAGIRTVADYRKQVPVAPYEAARPVHRAGEERARRTPCIADDTGAAVRPHQRHHRRPQVHPDHRPLPAPTINAPGACGGCGRTATTAPGDLALRADHPDWAATRTSSAPPAGVPCGNLSGYTALRAAADRPPPVRRSRPSVREDHRRRWRGTTWRCGSALPRSRCALFTVGQPEHAPHHGPHPGFAAGSGIAEGLARRHAGRRG